MTEKYQPEEEFIIEDVETLKVLADARRLRILEVVGRRPRTVKEIAEMLDTPAGKLYYHVNLMEKHQLIRVVETQIVSGIIEKKYQAAAHRYVPGPGLLTADPEMVEMETAVLSIFDKTKEDLVRSFRQGIVEVNKEAPLTRQLEIMQAFVTLSEEDLARFHARLMELLEEMTQTSRTTSADEGRYNFFLTMFPAAERKSKPTGDEKDGE